MQSIFNALIRNCGGKKQLQHKTMPKSSHFCINSGQEQKFSKSSLFFMIQYWVVMHQIRQFIAATSKNPTIQNKIQCFREIMLVYKFISDIYYIYRSYAFSWVSTFHSFGDCIITPLQSNFLFALPVFAPPKSLAFTVWPSPFNERRKFPPLELELNHVCISFCFANFDIQLLHFHVSHCQTELFSVNLGPLIHLKMRTSLPKTVIWCQLIKCVRHLPFNPCADFPAVFMLDPMGFSTTTSSVDPNDQLWRCQHL